MKVLFLMVHCVIYPGVQWSADHTKSHASICIVYRLVRECMCGVGVSAIFHLYAFTHLIITDRPVLDVGVID